MSRLRRFWRWLCRVLGEGDTFLCDSCRYDHPSACRHPERPNATRCQDYKPR